jgi:hypothetical protein
MQRAELMVEVLAPILLVVLFAGWMCLVIYRAEIPKRLARNAAHDPAPGVRLASLRALQCEFPNRKLTRNVSQVALDDGDPAVRLAAVRFLEPRQGFQALQDLVLGDPTIDSEIHSEALRLFLERAPLMGEQASQTLQSLLTGDVVFDAGTRVEAFRLLVERAPREMVLPVLDRILDDAPQVLRSWTITGGRFHDEVQSELWRQAAAASGALGHTGATARLISALDWQDPASAKVVAQALGAIGDPAAEPALIKLLDSQDEGTAVAAAHALERVGTVVAVEPLHARIDRIQASLALKRTGREAIESIQGRLTGAERGQLGLAEAAGAQGRLTVSDPSPHGSVSLSQPGRTSGDSEPV